MKNSFRNRLADALFVCEQIGDRAKPDVYQLHAKICELGIKEFLDFVGRQRE